MESKWWEYQTKQEAIDYALWLNFRYHSNDTYFVVDGPEHYAVVNQLMLSELGGNATYDVPDSYQSLDWDVLTQMKQREELPSHWNTLFSALSGIGSEVLHFMITYKVSIALLMCHELALRGCDTQGQWVGFDTSDKIWKEVYTKFTAE